MERQFIENYGYTFFYGVFILYVVKSEYFYLSACDRDDIEQRADSCSLLSVCF